tara:strand:+ start:483 stop:1070 length:588 start_codon:yes stop_codon:yes gene_type:complete
MASKIKVDQIQTGDGTGTIALQNQLSGMTSTSMPTGSVIQTLSSTYTGQASGTTNAWTLPHADCSLTITPSSSTNKILITVNSYMSSAGNAWAGIGLFKDGTHIAQNAETDNQIATSGGTGYITQTYNAHYPHVIQATPFSYYDISGSTSAIVYQFRVRARNSGGFWGVNRTVSGASDDANMAPTSTITLMEIKA